MLAQHVSEFYDFSLSFERPHSRRIPFNHAQSSIHETVPTSSSSSVVVTRFVQVEIAMPCSVSTMVGVRSAEQGISVSIGKLWCAIKVDGFRALVKRPRQCLIPATVRPHIAHSHPERTLRWPVAAAGNVYYGMLYHVRAHLSDSVPLEELAPAVSGIRPTI